MTGFVLLFAVVCLGGVIATVGDRIGMKVGKSRLSLFNLRPRQTATLVSVATGMVASFATLMLLFALDGQLRKGVFQLEDIQLELSKAQSDLESTQIEKDEVEDTLDKSTQLQAEAQDRLQETNESLQTAIAREEETLANLLDTQSQLDEVSEQAGSLRDEIGGLRSEREALIAEQAEVRSRIAQRDAEIAQRNGEIAERNQQIEQRNQQLTQRDQELQQRTADLGERDRQIAQRNDEIAERETRLEALQTQQAFLSKEISRLEDEFQGLRLGNVAIARNETLAFTVARPDSEQNAIQAVEQALGEANRFAVQTILPGTETVDNFTIRFDPVAVSQIVSSITDSQNYVIKVASAANYVTGEPCVADALRKAGPPCLLVNVTAIPNEVVFRQGDVLASVDVSAEDIRNNRLVERFTILRATAEFEARRSDIVRYQPIVASGFSDPIIEFLTRVEAYGKNIEIQAFASQPIFPASPVYLELAAVQNGQVIFRTRADAVNESQ